MTADLRWQQRFANYCRALKLLDGFSSPLRSMSVSSRADQSV